MPKKKSKRKSDKKLQSKKSNGSLTNSFNNLLQFRYLGLAIAVLYFVILLILSLAYHKVGDYGIETDFFWGYVPAAKSFINGDLQIDQFRGPLYPIVLSLVNLLISDYFVSGIVIGVLSASILIFLSFELIKNIFSPIVSFFVTLLVAPNPIFVQYSYSAGTDMMFNVLAVATLYFFFKDKELNTRNIFIASVLGGLSYLTRYNGVFLFGFVFIILFVNYWNNDWVQRIKSSFIFVAVFILTFSPWGFYCLSKKGSFFYNENYKNIAFELYGKGKITWDQFWFSESSNFTSFFDVIGRDPYLFISTTIGNIGDHFLLDMERLMGWYVGAFVILGLISLLFSNPFKNWKSRETGYYLSNLFFFALLTLVFYSERFSIFLISFYSVIAVQSFFIERFELNKRIPLKLGYLIVISLIAVTLNNSISFNSKRIDSGPKELLVLQDWYYKNIPESERGYKIAARKAHLAYYLGMDFVLIPTADSYNEFVEKLRQKNVDYLYISPIEARLREEFKSLLNPNSSHPGLKVVVYFNHPPSVLYRVMYN